MKLDPTRLRPTELVQLLNSTALGEVINERIMRALRRHAGLRFAAAGDTSRVHAFRFGHWIAHQKHDTEGTGVGAAYGDAAYDAHKERARQRNKSMSESGRDIGELPEIVNPERRAACERDFRLFCEEYFPASFPLEWSEDHLKVISKIEVSVLEGGLFAMAMPRGSGKTTLCEIACIWALVYGHREFVTLIGSDEDHASNMLDSVKVEFETNERLLEDFPKVVYPIHCLEGIHQRAGGQLYEGKQTYIGWSKKEIVLPTMPDSPASGGIIRVAGITGRVRGMKYKRPDGQSVRPSLVLIDDPQTDESARSPSQCATRERILAGAILGLSGPGRKIAGLMTVTVVREDDMADRILDRSKHPQWQGERTRMVYLFPANEALWDRYAQLRAEGLRAERGLKDATAFYRKNRKQMDVGARVAWEARHNPDELSALQHAMNLRYQDEHAFWAEYQNQPLPDEEPDDQLLTADQIAAKTNGLPRGRIPLECSHLTAFIDVQGKALFWLVAAWSDDFTGTVVDYGTEPDQKRPYFTLREIRRTLKAAAPRAGLEAAIYAGLERLSDHLLDREWKRDDGAMVRVDRCLIDANWGESTDVVYQFCRQSRHASLLLPSHGRYVGASTIPFSEYKRKRGDRLGHNWRIPSVAGKRAVRHVVFDANSWKSFVQARFAVPMGDPGCLALWGREASKHRLLAEHLTSEYRVVTEGRGRSVDEWKIRTPGSDNHWLDCLVGAAVAASIQGASLMGEAKPRRARKRIKLSELKR